MIESYLLNHPWLPASLWAVLYTSDYYLTIWGSRLYRGQDVFLYEGSYELTPGYEQDIDKQRLVSPRFVMWLIGGAVILLGTGYLPGSKYVYGMFVGYFLIIEVAVHLRHMQCITTYRRLIGPDPGVTGRMCESRAAVYTRSAQEMAGLGLFTLLTFALTNSPILLGGAVSLLSQSSRHVRLARWHRKHSAADKPR